MKNHWIIIRIVVALIAIFSLGIWVGRVTAPPQEGQPLEITIEEDEGVDRAELRLAVLRSITRYRNELGLTNDQVKKLRPEFVTVSRRMQVLPKLSKARLAVIEDFHDQIRGELSEDQQEKLRAIMKVASDRHRSE